MKLLDKRAILRDLTLAESDLVRVRLPETAEDGCVPVAVGARPVSSIAEAVAGPPHARFLDGAKSHLCWSAIRKQSAT